MALAVCRPLLAETPAAPLVTEGKTVRVSEHVWVIPDGRVNLVPNIGIVRGRDAVLVIDSGMGPRNGEAVLREVRKIAPNAPLYLTTTHFHPEHVSGFQAFPASAKLLRPAAQQEELATKSAALVDLFTKMSPVHAELLRPVKMRQPDFVFGDFVEINLGGVTARVFTLGPAHTRGDAFVLVQEDNLLFGGDVITNRFFPIILDESGAGWIKVLDQAAKLKPVTVVPGHGETGGADLIAQERAFLAAMQSRTQELKGQGKSVDQIVGLATAELKTKYPRWENPEFLEAGIRRFYAEAPRPGKR